jgi:diacylglycerol kinase (ATP)
VNRSSTFVIFNPEAGRGRGAQRIERFRRLFSEAHLEWDEAVTERAGDERVLADRALEAGYEKIVACGGDGTWSGVADRVIRSGRPDVALGLLPSGTGNDFGKTFGITWRNAESVVRGIAVGCTETIDVGRVDGRHFLNVVGIGFDIAVIDDASGFPWLRGDALYRFCAIRQLFRFPGVSLAISTNGSRAEFAEHLMLVVANARYFGGSFHIAPTADLHDGELDLVAFRNAGPLRRARLFDLALHGRHADAPDVRVDRAKRFEISFEVPLRFEVDGEVLSSSGESLTIESVPKALRLLIPGGGGAP